MGKNVIKTLVVLCVIVFLAGCTAKTYVQERARVDQKITGNAGCIYGTCPDRGEYKTTRQTVVLELITKPKDVSDEELAAAETPRPVRTYETHERAFEPARPQTPRPQPQPVVIYEPERIAASATTYTDYKVEEGDTLQKISKKFYDTYKRWHEIYEANKDVIANPDRIRPGITIRIPAK